MIAQLTKIVVIAVVVCLLVGSSFAQFQENSSTPSTKRRSALNKLQRQADGTPAPEVLGHWNALTARSKDPLAVSWNRKTGTPQAIFGRIPSPTGNASESSARSFLSQNAPLFKLNKDTSELELIRNFDSVLGRHFVFEQEYRGVPVYGAQVAIHFNQTGEIITVNNTYEPGVAL